MRKNPQNPVWSTRVLNFFSRIPLIRTATAIGVVGLGAIICVHTYVQRGFKKEEYYKQTISLFKKYPYTESIFGESFRLRNLDLSTNGQNYSDGYSAKLTIPVVGSLNSGNIHCWATRETVEKGWNIDKLDLEVNKKQWTFYTRNEEKANSKTSSK